MENLFPTVDQKDMDQYVDHCVAIFLNNGIKLTGMVEATLPTGLFLLRDGQAQLVLYRAISTIQRT